MKIINIHSHRIHGAGIYANIGGILMVNVTIYSIHGSCGIDNYTNSFQTFQHPKGFFPAFLARRKRCQRATSGASGG